MDLPTDKSRIEAKLISSARACCPPTGRAGFSTVCGDPHACGLELQTLRFSGVRAYFLAALACCTACDGAQVFRAELGALNIRAGFLAVVNAENQVTRLTPPFGFDESGALSFGTLPALELEEQERGGLLVALDDEILASAVPHYRYLQERAGEVIVEQKTPPATPEIVAPDLESEFGEVFVALPKETRMYPMRAADDATELGAAASEAVNMSLRSLVRVRIPVDFEPTRIEGLTQIDRLGGDPMKYLEPRTGMAVAYFRDLERVGPNHMALLSWSHLRVIRLDEHYIETATNTVQISDFGTPVRVEVDPRSPPDSLQLYLTFEGGMRGRLQVYTFDQAGLRFTQTATISDFPLGDLAFASDGRLVIGSARSTDILERGAGETIFRRSKLPGPDAPNVSRVLATKNPDYPILATTYGKVYFWSSALRSWAVEDLGADAVIPEPARVKALASLGTGDNFQVWAAANDGQIYHRFKPNMWARHELPQPPRAYRCNENLGPPLPGGQHSVETLAVNEERLFVTLSSCSPVFVLDHQVTKSALVLRGGEPPKMEMRGFHEMSVEGNELFLAGDEARFYGATW